MIEFALDNDDFVAFNNAIEFALQSQRQNHYGELTANGITLEWTADELKVRIEEE